MQKKKKIIFVSYYFWPPHFGGELKIAIERFITLSKRGYEVVVFTSGVEGYLRKETMDGLQILRSPIIGSGRVAKRINRLIYWFWLYGRLFFEKQVRVVHIEAVVGVLGYIPAHFYAFILLKIARFKKSRTVCVHSLATNDTNYFQIKTKWEGRYYQNIDKIVCVSDALFDAVRQVYPQSATLALCGIHDDVFKPLASTARQLFRQENQILDNEIVFSFLGSLEKRKGLDLIVASLINQQSNLNWKLWLICPYRKQESQYIHEDQVKEIIAPLDGIKDRVMFWGKVDDRTFLSKLLSASDVFLFPTRREGFGIAPLEAMSAGTPVIVSRIPGVTDLASIDNVTGLYVQPGSQEELESAMIRLAEDPAMRKSMGEQGRKRILEKFSWHQHVDHWEVIYFGSENE
jgi:glycosyltransferase involved in cell wall biosynthesis